MNINFLLLVGFIVFFLGIALILLRNTFLFILLGIELSFVALSFILFLFSRIQGNPMGEVFVILLFGIAASGVAIGLGLLFNIVQKKDTQEIDFFKDFKG